MNKRISTIFLIALFLSSCAKVEIPPTPTVAIEPVETVIEPVKTPTPTEIPATPTEAAPKEGDVTTVTENGHDYVYTYTELGKTVNGEVLMEDVREAGTIMLFDGPVRNYLPFQIFVAGNVENERGFVSITHQDGTDINNPFNPLTTTLFPELRIRYFQDDPRKETLDVQEHQKALQVEMRGEGPEGHSQAYLDIIVANGTPEGAVKRVKLSETTGIILTIMTAEDIDTLGGENVLELHAQGDGRNYTYFVQVYDVDEKGNELVRVAFQDPLSQIPEEVLRKVLFSIPGNLIDHKDQREQGFTNVAQIFAQYSAKTNETTGKQDFVIELLPAPALTPTP